MCKRPHAAGTEKGPRAGNAQPSAAADLLLQRSTSGREEAGREEKPDFWSQRRGRDVGGSWRKSEWRYRDWEADPAAHGVVRSTAQAPSPAPTPWLRETLLCWGEQGVRGGHGGDS